MGLLHCPLGKAYEHSLQRRRLIYQHRLGMGQVAQILDKAAEEVLDSADIGKIRSRLGFEPRVPLERGYDDLAAWAVARKAADRFDEATGELISRGLLRGR